MANVVLCIPETQGCGVQAPLVGGILDPGAGSLVLISFAKDIVSAIVVVIYGAHEVFSGRSCVLVADIGNGRVVLYVSSVRASRSDLGL